MNLPNSIKIKHKNIDCSHEIEEESEYFNSQFSTDYCYYRFITSYELYGVIYSQSYSIEKIYFFKSNEFFYVEVLHNDSLYDFYKIDYTNYEKFWEYFIQKSFNWKKRGF